tara:strand:- start:185 stop:460 length:276 start_codon:yes stop_codon:yes gene_type:complete
MEKTQIKHNAIENEVFDAYRKIEEAKTTLKNNGYFVDNLWSTEDVFRNFKCTEEEAQEVLEMALTNEATMEQIWFAIDFHGEDNQLTEVNN